MANPTFTTAYIRNSEKYPIIPVNSSLTCEDSVLPRKLRVNIMSEDGTNAIVQFVHKNKIYQTVVPQDNLMIDFRVIFKS